MKAQGDKTEAEIGILGLSCGLSAHRVRTLVLKKRLEAAQGPAMGIIITVEGTLDGLSINKFRQIGPSCFYLSCFFFFFFNSLWT